SGARVPLRRVIRNILEWRAKGSRRREEGEELPPAREARDGDVHATRTAGLLPWEGKRDSKREPTRPRRERQKSPSFSLETQKPKAKAQRARDGKIPIQSASN